MACQICGNQTQDCDGIAEPTIEGCHKSCITSQLEAQILKVKGLRADLESKTQELHLLQVEFKYL